MVFPWGESFQGLHSYRSECLKLSPFQNHGAVEPVSSAKPGAPRKSLGTFFFQTQMVRIQNLYPSHPNWLAPLGICQVEIPMG